MNMCISRLYRRLKVHILRHILIYTKHILRVDDWGIFWFLLYYKKWIYIYYKIIYSAFQIYTHAWNLLRLFVKRIGIMKNRSLYNSPYLKLSKTGPFWDTLGEVENFKLGENTL